MGILAIVNTILLAILVLEVGLLLWHHRQREEVYPLFLPDGAQVQGPHIPESPTSSEVELLRRDAHGVWCHHSWRRVGHPDILEALATPGLAVRRNGAVEEGRQ